ncbi:MAG TPA: sodium:alanine symporter family protein, partial [Acidobacteria bacterium]|nr:sodium:alanine symporter family protein [Acidobacteriota bacterium]
EWRRIPEIFSMVLGSAFSGHAALGGFLGATVKETIRMGVARGVFSNESGLGSAGIAAAAAQTNLPATQALVSMTQTFIDTIVVCSLTGFVILTSGVWTVAGPSGHTLTGAPLTAAGFDIALPGGLGRAVVSIGLILFAYSTILGWSYYGEKSLEFLLGERSVLPYRILFCVVVFFGAVQPLALVWTVADIFNGLMAVPNLIGLLILSGIVARETRQYFIDLSDRS